MSIHPREKKDGFHCFVPWVPEDIFFSSILMVRSEAGLTKKKITSIFFLVNPASPRNISIDKKKISSGTQGNCFDAE